MEPNNISKPQLERMPSNASRELNRKLDTSEHEAQPKENAERQIENGNDLSSTARDQAMPLPVLPTPIVAPVANSSADDDSTIITPAVAADDDIIEKEWVDRAKKIVSDTRDDPYEQKKEVGYLQRSYLKKRYGKDIGATD